MRARLRSLASWTMLTASTIGPGTVAMCAKAGADTNEKLLWCVLVASTVAWVLQENAGRLTLVSNMSLGECALAKLPCGSYRAVLRWALTLFVVLGGLAYEANNISGTMAAVQVVVSDESALCLINVALGPLCALLLCGGSTQRVSYFLSSVVILMILCFSIAVVGSGLPSSFLGGIIPSIPAGKAELALGLIGTTAIPHNLLLGSVLARGVSLAHMRQGVLLASALSGLISLLILLVGTRADVRASDFELRHVADVLASVMGPAGIWVFALGLFGAGLSSAMTVPLACAVAVEDMCGLRKNSALASQECSVASVHADAEPTQPCGLARSTVVAANRKSEMWGRMLSRCTRDSNTSADFWHAIGRDAFMTTIILLALIPSLFRLPTITVIMFAQVVNGCLLPCVASLLFVCINDKSIVRTQPQTACANARTAPCVAIVVFMAVTVLVKQTVCRLVVGWSEKQAMAIACPCSAVCLALIGYTALMRASSPQVSPRPNSGVAVQCMPNTDNAFQH